MQTTGREHPRIDALDRGILALGAILVPGTMLLSLMPNLEGHVWAPSLDLVLDTTAAVVAVTLSVLLWLRHRERGEPILAFASSAFLALAIGNGYAVYLAINADLGSTALLLEDGQKQQLVFLVSRILAATVLVIGGANSLGSFRTPSIPVVVLGPALAVGATTFLAERWVGALPVLIEQIGSASQLPHVQNTGIGLATQVLSVTLLLIAAVVWRRLWRRDRVPGEAFLSVALVLAAVAEVHGALFPTVHPVQVSTADALWLAFDVTLLLAIEADTRLLLSRLRRANHDLGELRASEVERAALVERTRLSRELHDGLAQDLWFTKLKVARLAALDLPPEPAQLTSELVRGIDAALADARQAVMALRIGGDGGSLADILGAYLIDFGDRFGIRIEYERAAELPRVSFRAEAELLRIVHEALTNVVRHADATLIQVGVDVGQGEVVLTISDNGRGFDPERVGADRFGVAGMRERVDLLRGRLTLRSQAHDGTYIEVAIPSDARLAPA